MDREKQDPCVNCGQAEHWSRSDWRAVYPVRLAGMFGCAGADARWSAAGGGVQGTRRQTRSAAKCLASLCSRLLALFVSSTRPFGFRF